MGISSKIIFITGINGFVGSSVAQYYLNKGFKVVGLVKEFNFKTQPDILNKCAIVKGDIRDKDLLRGILSNYEVNYVLHLASMPIVRVCYNDPETAYSTNIMGVVSLLEAVRALIKKPEKIIIFTSDKSYGPLSTLPYVENMNPTFGDTYSTTKTCQDLIAHSYAQTYNIPLCIIRSGNIYGPGDLNLSRLIPNNILRALKGENLIVYKGVAEYLRDFVYIQDELEAFNTVFENGILGEAYNVGGIGPTRIQTVVETIVECSKTGVRIEYPEKYFDEIEKQWLDDTKLRKLGWSPKVDLRTGIKNSIDWYKRFV